MQQTALLRIDALFEQYVVDRVWNDGNNKSGSSRDLFVEMYKKERAPWDIERPQPAIVAAQSLGFFKGRYCLA